MIARIWDDPQTFDQTGPLKRSEGHWSWIGDTAYTYFYRELAGYGPEPLVIGVAFPAADTRLDRWTPRIAAGLGLVMMVVAAVLAWRLGLKLSRPASDFDGALDTIARLQFDKVALPGLTGSRVREWRSMAGAIENTARALTAFQTYLPRVLVRRLFGATGGQVESQEREITVMFADLEGFTAFSRERAADAVAAYLNDVFGLIGPIVEASGGVIDKYTGDGMLAFWGAPDTQPDHPLRASASACTPARPSSAISVSPAASTTPLSATR